MRKLLGTGNALVDILIRINNDSLLEKLSLPKGGMTLIDKEKANHILNSTAQFDLRKSAGGSVANTINGLAHLGISTGFIGTVGKDKFGSFFSQEMTENSVDAHLSFINEETGKSLVLISEDSERTMATYLGSAVYLDKSTLNQELFSEYDYFYLEGYLLPLRDYVIKALKIAKSTGNKISIDLSSFSTVEENREFLEQILHEYVDIVFANESEARVFTGKDDLYQAAQNISEKCQIAVVKCGSNGSIIQQGSDYYKIEPEASKAIDTTGAGDLYAAGFFYGLMNEYPLEMCGQLGSMLGGKVVEIVGARMGEQEWKEIETLLRSFVNKKGP